MKKIRFLILMTLSAGMFAVSCSSDDNGTTTTPDDKTNSAPVITNQTTTAEVDEDANTTLTIFTVIATDADAEDTLTFEITGGNGQGLFNINENGLITLADGKYLDFETATGHSITVTVSDGNGGTDQISIQITVQNVIELHEDSESFIFTLETTVADEVFSITTFGEDVDFQIDWGNGQGQKHITDKGEVIHQYQDPGTYTVALKGQMDLLIFGGQKAALQTVEQWGTTAWKYMRNMFSLDNFDIIVAINAEDKPNLAQCTSLEGAFVNADFKQDINDWDVSKVTNMYGTFAYNTTFNQDISGWDVGQVTNMESMFNRAESFNQDISGWDIGSVEHMENMFNRAESFNQSIGNWDVGNVQSMEGMFFSASAFNQDISGWDISKVENIGFMFSYATAFDQDLGAWNIGNVTYMVNMLVGSGMSAPNFSNTLIGWADQDVKPDIILEAQGVNLCEGEAVEDAYNYLTNENFNNNWTINYDGNIPCN
ncbi:BspA family leucine-rich repeat surface protein [Flagellimonas sp. 389]|uniref:BspA family leucine-rich repeat surface protein n=1 Tax=Flagellimonas sp. 389 TaxID=2835862 RepID=UPI001BD5AA88|nr:BspA family leucine-rich repeat surface protein [Flagellimonas sp. 389]MBS9461153.1 BspA family leucine-rich repeat surface protein [Flagellimonas sp. 389]